MHDIGTLVWLSSSERRELDPQKHSLESAHSYYLDVPRVVALSFISFLSTWGALRSTCLEEVLLGLI